LNSYWEFVEKEYAVVGKGDFARLRVVAAADESHVGDGMVRGAERPAGDQRVIALQ
jgi:hypothetical protein